MNAEDAGSHGGIELRDGVGIVIGEVDVVAEVNREAGRAVDVCRTGVGAARSGHAERREQTKCRGASAGPEVGDPDVS